MTDDFPTSRPGIYIAVLFGMITYGAQIYDTAKHGNAFGAWLGTGALIVFEVLVFVMTRRRPA